MENQRGKNRGDLITLGLLLSVLIAGANGSCRLLSIDTQANACTSLTPFSACSSSVRGSVVVTSATVSVASGSSVDATEAANDIIQCSEKACTELVYFLLDHYSRQFCFTLETVDEDISALTAVITVSYSESGMSQTPFEATFAGWDDNSLFNGPFGSCSSFTIESLTSGPTATPSVGSSLNQYHHGDCNEQAAVSTPSATTQPATTQPETTQPTTTQPVTTQPTTTQPVTTQPATTQPETTQPATTQPETTHPTTTQPVTMQPTTTHSTTTQPITTQSATTSRGTTVAVEGRCETFKIGATLENCHPRVSLCSNPDFNSSAITVVSATLRVSEASPVDITRLAQNIIACSQPACEGALYEVIQMYSRVECLSAVDGPKTISIEIEYTYESFTFSIQTNSLFTIDEDGLHSEHCDNLYYESRPNMTSNSVEYPFNCSLLDESRYGESTSASTPGSTVEKRGCPPMTKGFVAGTSLGFESCGATFIIVSDSLDMADAQVTFESMDQNDVVGGAINVLQDDIDFLGNQLHVISLVMIIDIENGNTSFDLNGSVVIDFAVDLTAETNAIHCAFIANESSGVWSNIGMELVFANSSLVQCRSNHLTSFAVLLSAKPPRGIHAVIQSYLSRVMGALSVLSLTVAICIYFATGTWKLLKIQIHMNLAISTALGQLLFMTMAEMTWNVIICKTIAVTLHYLFTSALAWTMIEGVFLYRTTAVGFKPLHIGWLSLFAWGGSLVVVGVSFGVLYDGYGTTKVCWLRHDDYTIYVFVGCVFAVLLFNSMILFFVMKSFMALKANAKKDELDKIKAMARALLILLPILGLTWFSGAVTSITTSDDVIFFQYLFTISFGLQGVCILIFHCLQVPVIKATLKNRFHRRVQDSSWMSKSGAPRSTATSSF